MKTKYKYLLLILWMGVIFYLSGEPATESSARSGEIIEAVRPFLSLFSVDNMTSFVRKSAHVVAYFILGILVYNVVRAYNFTQSRTIAISMFFSLLYAVSDEIHQMFVPGRSGELRDVLLDTAAATLGIALIHLYFRNKTPKRQIH